MNLKRKKLNLKSLQSIADEWVFAEGCAKRRQLFGEHFQVLCTIRIAILVED
jgi:hypothetical protein